MQDLEEIGTGGVNTEPITTTMISLVLDSR
jgi:hypothetical protein